MKIRFRLPFLWVCAGLLACCLVVLLVHQSLTSSDAAASATRAGLTTSDVSVTRPRSAALEFVSKDRNRTEFFRITTRSSSAAGVRVARPTVEEMSEVDLLAKLESTDKTDKITAALTIARRP